MRGSAAEIRRERASSASRLGLALALMLPGRALAGPPSPEPADERSVDEPRPVPRFPWVAELVADPERAAFERHACPGGALVGPGPETVLALPPGSRGRLIAWVEDQDAGLIVIDGQRCLAADTTWLETELDGSEAARLIVEHPPTRASAVVHLVLLGPAWTEQALAEGVVWRARRGDHDGEPQLIQQVIVDLDQPGVELRLVEPGPNVCASVAEIARRAEPAPVAAINSSFFDPWPCVATSMSSSLMRQDGELLAINSDRGTPKAALGFTPEGELLTTVVEAGGDWPQTAWALGARGLLLERGRAVAPERWQTDENVFGHFVANRHPRSALAFDVDGGFAVLTTVDGRRPSAAGMTLTELQALVAAPIELADGTRVLASDAINIDGGGSTTMWVAGLTPTGVANYPSDGNLDGPPAISGEHPAHAGSREVVGALLVYAPPLGSAPSLATTAPVAADPNREAVADSDAATTPASRCRVNNAGHASPALVMLVLFVGLCCIRCNR